MKWFFLPVVWLLLTGLFLEILLRLAVPVLPDNMQQTARRVLTGRPYVEGYNPSWLDDRDHFRIMQPGLDNVVQYGTPSVAFHVSTINLWDGRIGFRTRPIDYFVDAVVVGDSFAFCFTEIEDCWVTILERSTGMGMVNLGQPVTGSMSRRRILGTYAAPLTPPLVIWEFFGNDFNDDYGLAVLRGELDQLPDPPEIPPPPTPVPAPPLLNWLQRSSVLYAQIEVALTGRWGGMGEIDLIYHDPHHVRYRDGVLEFGRYIDRMTADMRRPSNQAGFAITRQALLESQALVETWDGRLVIVLIPMRELVYAHLTAPILGEEGMRAFGGSHQAMLDLCAELQLTCLDTLPLLRAHAENGAHLYYTDDPHLNPYGNAVLAELVEAWLSDAV